MSKTIEEKHEMKKEKTNTRGNVRMNQGSEWELVLGFCEGGFSFG